MAIPDKDELKMAYEAEEVEVSIHCENCGCRMDGGMCLNCHEELYILTHQGDYIDRPPSNEFIEKAESQKEEVKENMRKRKRKAANQENRDDAAGC